MAEVLVRSGAGRAKYVSVLGDTWKFQILPFDSRAAIEAADLIAAIKSSKEKWDTWAKVKFDIQIVAIAKAEAATLIYSDDRDIENFAKRLNIRVMRICDLPLPPAEKDPERPAGPEGSQGLLNLAPSETKPEQPPAAQEPKEEVKADAAKTAANPSNELKTDPAHPTPVQGSNEGRAQGETTGAGKEKAFAQPTKGK